MFAELLGALGGLRSGGNDLCTLTPDQKTKIAMKLINIHDARERMMDPSNNRNKLLNEALDAEYEERDFRKAFRLYYRAIEEDNHEVAICTLGLWYLQGRPGTSKQPLKAVEYFQRAADMGNGMALANLCEFTYGGFCGVKKDLGKAYALARAAIDDDRHTNDSLSMAFWTLFKIHQNGRPGKAKNTRAALRCLEYAAIIDGSLLSAERGTHEALLMMRMLAVMDPEAAQSETDRRYDRMAYELDRLPEDQKPSTYGEYIEALGRYGFELVDEGGLPANRDKKCNWPKFIKASGPWRLIPGYKSPEGDDDNEDELTDTPTARAGSGASGGNDAGCSSATGGSSNGTGASGSASGSGGPGFMCGQCKKMGATKKCARCGQHYCSVECQRQDWREGHKRICDRVAAERA